MYVFMQSTEKSVSVCTAGMYLFMTYRNYKKAFKVRKTSKNAKDHDDISLNYRKV